MCSVLEAASRRPRGELRGDTPAARKMRAGIALGANLGDRLLCLTTAREPHIRLAGSVAAVSVLRPLRNRADRMRSGRGEISQRCGRDRLCRYLPATAGGVEENRNRSRAAARASRAIARARSISTCFITARARSMSRSCNCRIRVCICADLFSIRWPKFGPISSCPGQTQNRPRTDRRTIACTFGGACRRGNGSVARHGGFSRAQTPRRTHHRADRL